MLKLRNKALIATLMIGTALTPISASALSLSGILGGGGNLNIGMACGSAGGLGGLIGAGARGILDSVTGGMGSIYIDQATGAVSIVNDVMGNGDASGGAAGGGGNCVKERKPFVVEDTLKIMRTVGLHTISPEINRALAMAQQAINIANRVQWQVAAANADFQQMFPYILEASTPQEIVAHRTEQEQLAKENSRSSKLGTSALMQDIPELRERIADLLAASKKCHNTGQTCAIDVNTQMVALNAELSIRAMTVASTGNRAQEGWLDYWMGSMERGKAAWKIANEGLGSIAETGSTDGWQGM